MGQFLTDEHDRTFVIVNCPGPDRRGHDDGFGENFRVYTDDTDTPCCPKCLGTDNLRVMKVFR